MLQVGLTRLRPALTAPLWIGLVTVVAMTAAAVGAHFVGGLAATVVGACAVGVMAGYSTSGSV